MPPRTGSAPALPSVEGFVKSLRDPGRNLVEQYRGKPAELAARFGVNLPRKPLAIMQELGVYDETVHGPITPGLREFVIDVCTLTVKNAVAVACRGGGKSFGVSFIEFYLWMIEDFDCINLGGSEAQADNVYRYLLEYMDDSEFWKTLIKGEVQREKTFKDSGAWVRVLAASQKSVRSPHAGGKKKVKGKFVDRGGFLAIDEEAETERDIVEASLSTVNTGRPSVNCRASTFHNVGGTFQEVIDHATEMRYTVYQWDVFDICEGCDCGEGAGCQSEEKCFREDHYEDYIDPDSGELKKRLLHRAYCGGRAKYAEGHMPYSEILTLWRRFRKNHARWEVEAMGLRPSSKGYVIRDLTKFSTNIVEETGTSLYVKGSPVTICVDWGTGAAGVEVWQEQMGGNHVLLHADLMIDNNQTQIVGKILEYAAKYLSDLLEIAADIGGGGNYLNPELRDVHGLPVRDVVFSVEKESAVAAWNSFNEAEKITIPKEHVEFIEQVQNWKRKNGRIGKGNDHLCDAAVCYFARFVEQLGIPPMGVPPVTFRSGGPARVDPRTGDPVEGVDLRSMPVAVTIGKRGRSRAR